MPLYPDGDNEEEEEESFLGGGEDYSRKNKTVYLVDNEFLNTEMETGNYFLRSANYDSDTDIQSSELKQVENLHKNAHAAVSHLVKVNPELAHDEFLNDIVGYLKNEEKSIQTAKLCDTFGRSPDIRAKLQKWKLDTQINYKKIMSHFKDTNSVAAAAAAAAAAADSGSKLENTTRESLMAKDKEEDQQELLLLPVSEKIAINELS